MSSYDFISVEIADEVAVIRFQRDDKRNAFTRTFLAEIASAVQAAGLDDGVHVLILTGSDGCFSSGADMREFLEISAWPAAESHLRNFRATLAAIESCPKPVIAAVNGYCLTGGLELAMSCDFRIGDEESTYAITSARMGSLAGAGGTQRLPRLVGTARALEILMMADRFDAQQALAYGLLMRVVPAAGALPAALELARELSTRPPLSLALAKRAVLEGSGQDLQAGLDLELELVRQVFRSREQVEGMTSVLEHREQRHAGS